MADAVMAPAASDAEPSLSAPSPAVLQRAARSQDAVAGDAVRVFGTQDGGPLELLLIAPEAPDQAWVCYGDDQQQQLIPLAEVRLTAIKPAQKRRE
jgi:hypothetical protein